MHTFRYSVLLFSLASVMAGCSSGNEPDTPPTPDVPRKMQIKINPSATGTRVSDSSFDHGDRIGLFVVNYEADAPGSLKVSGNHVSNMGFTFNSSWSSDSPVYWKDDKTHADFYLYYPYMPNLATVEAIPFEVKEDQSTEQNYKASELLIGKALNVAPTEREVGITARHVMSQINITLEASDGFSSEDLSSSNVAVRINGVRTHSTTELATSSVSATGEPSTISPLLSNGVYKALLPPQTVAEGDLITVTVGDRDFNLKKAFTFESGKLHKFTVSMSKTSNGINVSISPWEDDGSDNGGIAE